MRSAQVSGQSCGGLMAIDAAVDPRITTAFPYDSGLFSRDQTVYDALHAPMAIFDGGPDDAPFEPPDVVLAELGSTADEQRKTVVRLREDLERAATEAVTEIMDLDAEDIREAPAFGLTMPLHRM